MGDAGRERTDRIERAGRALGEAWLRGRPVAHFPDELRARSRVEAYAVQDAMARVIGAPVVGWKLGATSPAMRRRAGHDGPVIGRVFAPVAFTSPARLPSARFRAARIECELAFRIGRTLAPRERPRSAAELAPDVELVAALEIIGDRYPKGGSAFVPTTVDEIADNGAGIGFVFGSDLPGWRALDLQRLPIDVRVDDGPPGESFLGDDRCNPLDALVEAVEILSGRGITLERGQIVSTGAATDPLPVAADSRVVAWFGELATIEATFVP